MDDETFASDLLDRLTAGADSADRSPDWPEASWEALRSVGILGWSVPPEYGGAGRAAVEGVRVGQVIASACLTPAFVLSRREAAVRQPVTGPAHLEARYLPGLAAGADFLTVGLSQLTTSRQHHGVDDARHAPAEPLPAPSASAGSHPGRRMPCP